MPKQAKPFFREEDDWWYLNVTENRKRRQVRLAQGRKNFQAAMKRFHEFKANQPKPAYNRRQPQQGAAWVTIQHFLDHAAANVAKTTYDWYAGYLNDFLAWLPDSISVAELKVHHVSDWMDSHKNWKASSRAAAVCSVRRCFKWAHEVGRIDRYPFPGLKAPVKPGREVIIAPDTFEKIILHSKPDFHPILNFWRETGARPQEARIAMIEQFDRQNKRIIIPPSKAKGKRVRVIYLSDPAILIVVAAIGKRKAGPIFLTSRHKPWTKNAVQQRLYRLGAADKVGQRVCAYNLRHSFATHALAAGVDPTTVGVLMGHADPSMINRVYQHLAQLPEHMQEAANRAGQRPQGEKRQ